MKNFIKFQELTLITRFGFVMFIIAMVLIAVNFGIILSTGLSNKSLLLAVLIFLFLGIINLKIKVN
jgi:hypothetical protein